MLCEAPSLTAFTPAIGEGGMRAAPAASLAVTYDYVQAPSARAASAFVKGAAFRDLYDVYASCFPYGAQPPEFFARMFACNRDRSMQNRWGPARYEIVTASRGGDVVGAAMFCVLLAPRGGWSDSPYRAAVGMDYCAVLPQMRGHGIARAFERMAFTGAAELAQEFHRTSDAPVFGFNEMALPLAMPFNAFAKDAERAGMHAFDRVEVWNNQGYLRALPSPGVPFYVDPPRLWYSFQVNIHPDEPWIGARTVADVVVRYNAVCGTNGLDPRAVDPNFDRMCRQLADRTIVPRVADADALKILRPASEQLLQWRRQGMLPDAGDASLGRLIEAHFPRAWSAYGRFAARNFA